MPGSAIRRACAWSPYFRTRIHARGALRYTVGLPVEAANRAGPIRMQVIEAKRNQGASSEVVRDINRRIVLNLIRTRQPISRADLARASGLQRSTISLIVEQLIE